MPHHDVVRRGAGARVTGLRIGGDEYAVLSYPVPAEDGGGRLTPAERAVLRALVEGRTRREIARLRGRAVATVNRQVEAIYQKLEVRSRAELVARVAGRGKK